MSFLDDFGFRPMRIGIAIIVILMAGTAYTTWRNARMDALAHSAVDQKPDPTALKRLAGYSGQRASDLLLVVASGAQTEPNRLAALQALVARKDAVRVSRLSELLLPPESLAVRQAIANAIYQTGCTPECVRNILYFQERMWRGDRPSEEIAPNPPAGLSEKEQELQTALDEILRKHTQALGVTGEKIEAIGASVAPEAGAEVIDLSREVCLPGLIDTHTHVLLQGDIAAEEYDVQLLKSSTPYRTILGTLAAKRALEYGFTTIRDLETEGAGYADVDIKKAINAGVIPGPHMQVAGRSMDVTGAYPLLGLSLIHI